MAGKIIKTLALILVISINALSGSDIAGTWNTGYKDIAPVPTLNVNAIKHTIEGSSYLDKEYRMTTSNILSTFDEAKFTQFAKDLQNEEFFGFFTAQISNAELERRIKAWENVLDAPFAVRTNTIFLSKIYELSPLGFTSVELKKIGNAGKQLAQKYGDDAFTLQVCDDIASAMKNAKNNGFDAFGVDINIGSSFNDLLSSANFKNSKADIENLTSQLRITSIDNPGFIEQINEGLTRMNSSPPRDIYIESAIKQGDIVDDYLQEAVQLKALTSTNPGKVSQRLTSAVNQFTSEVPPSGYKKIAEVRVLNSSNPVYGFSSNDLKTWLQTGVDNQNPTDLANYQSMNKLSIKTGLGIKNYKVDSAGAVIEL